MKDNNPTGSLFVCVSENEHLKDIRGEVYLVTGPMPDSKSFYNMICLQTGRHTYEDCRALRNKTIYKEII